MESAVGVVIRRGRRCRCGGAGTIVVATQECGRRILCRKCKLRIRDEMSAENGKRRGRQDQRERNDEKGDGCEASKRVVQVLTSTMCVLASIAPVVIIA